MRNSLEILRDMIRACQRADGLKKTRIMQACNMSPYQMGRYLDIIVRNGFVEYREPYYVATDRGVKFADALDSVSLQVNYNEQE